MTGKFKNNASFILLLVFLSPSIVKLEHHHEHIECKAKDAKHYHASHEKCAICSFEFSVFSSDFENIHASKEQPADNFRINYRFAHFSTLSDYSFLLRAPPFEQI
jgi:ribosomal protein L37E